MREVTGFEDAITALITRARGEFVELGQEPLDGCSMERFIARKLLEAICFPDAALEALTFCAGVKR